VHTQNIIHRDIKPENLVLSTDDQLKICDFGVAQILDDSQINIFSSKGSPAFLAPEVLHGKNAFKGKPVDVWASGVTLYAFIFGCIPWNASTYMGLVEQVKETGVVFPWEIDSSLRSLLLGMLEKDPATRLTIGEIKRNAWVTKNDAHMLDFKYPKVWVTRDEMELAITSIYQLVKAVVHRLKTEKYVQQFSQNLIKRSNDSAMQKEAQVMFRTSPSMKKKSSFQEQGFRSLDQTPRGKNFRLSDSFQDLTSIIKEDAPSL